MRLEAAHHINRRTKLSDAYDADMARENEIIAAIEASNEAATETAMSGATSRGGRPFKIDPIKLVAWKQAHGASIRATAERFGVGAATVKRYVRDYGKAAELERQRYQIERLDTELYWAGRGYAMMYLSLRNKALFWPEFEWNRRCEEAHGTERYASVLAGRDAAIDAVDAAFRESWERSMGPVPELSQHR